MVSYEQSKEIYKKYQYDEYNNVTYLIIVYIHSSNAVFKFLCTHSILMLVKVNIHNFIIFFCVLFINLDLYNNCIYKIILYYSCLFMNSEYTFLKLK